MQGDCPVDIIGVIIVDYHQSRAELLRRPNGKLGEQDDGWGVNTFGHGGFSNCSALLVRIACEGKSQHRCKSFVVCVTRNMASGISKLNGSFDVASLFQNYGSQLPSNGPIPATVIENRRRRALGRVQDALASRGPRRTSQKLKQEVKRLIRKWAQQSFSDGFPEMEEFEIRCAREHDLVVAQESGNEKKILQVLESDYRRRVIEQFGQTELRGLQTSERVFFELDKVFVPLYLSETDSDLNEMSQEDPQNFALQTLVRRMARVPVLEVIKRHRRLLIVGSPGSGKTTLIAYLATRAAQGRLFDGDAAAQKVLPFVLTVRAFTDSKVSAENIAQLTSCETKLVRHALTTNRAMLFVDGIDEAPRKIVPQILKSLTQFCTAHPKIPVVITSRPSDTIRSRTKALSDFATTELLTMTREEVDAFIDKWCLAAEVSVRKDVKTAERKGQEAADDLKQRLERSRPIQRLAETPLLTTILCIVHRFLGQRIPEQQVALYEKCTDALLYEWDRSKFSQTALVGEMDALAKRQLLSGLARKMHGQKQAEVAEAEVFDHFAKELPHLGHPADNAEKIITEIRDRGGVLIERRPGFFAFSHMVFQEYLTALTFFPQKYKELVDHYEDAWWHTVIVLAAGTQGADAGRLARTLLRKKEPVAVFLAAQCIETGVQIPLNIREEIERQIAKFVPPKTNEDIERLIELGVIAAPALIKALEGDWFLKDKSSLDELTLEEINTMIALGVIDYEPAIGILSRFAIKHGQENSYVKSLSVMAMCIIAYKAVVSKLARTTFLATVPKLSLDVASELAIVFLANMNKIFADKSNQATLEVLFEALPAKAKKEARQAIARTKAAADSDPAPENTEL